MGKKNGLEVGGWDLEALVFNEFFLRVVPISIMD
jgi:hypothetical protein